MTAKPTPDPLDQAITAVEQGPALEPYNLHVRLDPGAGGRERVAHFQMPGDTDPSEMVAIVQAAAEGFFMLVRRRNAKPTDRLWQPGKSN